MDEILATDPEDATAELFAHVMEGDAEGTEALVSHGVPPDCIMNDLTPLAAAAHQGFDAVAS